LHLLQHLVSLSLSLANINSISKFPNPLPSYCFFPSCDWYQNQKAQSCTMNSVNSKVLQDKDKPSLKSDQQQGLPSWQACAPDSPLCCVCIRLGKCQLLPHEDSSTWRPLLEQTKCSSVLHVQLCGQITSARHQRLKDRKRFTHCKYVIGAHDGCNKDANCTVIL
jgi:hypothetical protein